MTTMRIPEVATGSAVALSLVASDRPLLGAFSIVGHISVVDRVDDLGPVVELLVFIPRREPGIDFVEQGADRRIEVDAIG